MKNMKYIFYIALMLVFATSCTILKKSTPTANLNVSLNLNLNDLEYLGEATGTATQSYVLGIPYGGMKNKYGIINTQLLNKTAFPIRRGLNNAIYNALMQKPTADFILPISSETEIHQMFLGRREIITVKTRAYRFKTK